MAIVIKLTNSVTTAINHFMETEGPIREIPSDIVDRIFSFLDTKTQSLLSSSCKKFKQTFLNYSPIALICHRLFESLEKPIAELTKAIYEQPHNRELETSKAQKLFQIFFLQLGSLNFSRSHLRVLPFLQKNNYILNNYLRFARRLSTRLPGYVLNLRLLHLSGVPEFPLP